MQQKPTDSTPTVMLHLKFKTREICFYFHLIYHHFLVNSTKYASNGRKCLQTPQIEATRPLQTPISFISNRKSLSRPAYLYALAHMPCNAIHKMPPILKLTHTNPSCIKNIPLIPDDPSPSTHQK
jgi:hypothetical protein